MQSTSYSFLIASLICLLLALISTINTSVLFSSIFFIADSVLSGCTITLNWSSRGTCGTLLRGYFGVRARDSVLGRWNVVERRTLRAIFECTPFSAAFFASAAFLLAGVLGPRLGGGVLVFLAGFWESGGKENKERRVTLGCWFRRHRCGNCREVKAWTWIWWLSIWWLAVLDFFFGRSGDCCWVVW